VHLSVPTLTLVDIYVLLLLGVLMFFAWRSGQRDATLGFTCLMLLFGTVSTVLGCLRGMGSTWCRSCSATSPSSSRWP